MHTDYFSLFQETRPFQGNRGKGVLPSNTRPVIPPTPLLILHNDFKLKTFSVIMLSR